MKRIAVTLLLTLVAAVLNVAAQPRDEIALARASVTAHSTGNLLLEQLLLRRLMIETTSDYADAARHRLAENALERGDYTEAIHLLNSGDGTADENSSQVRRDRALMGEGYRLSRDNWHALAIFTSLLANEPNPAQPDDAALLAVRALDLIGGDTDETGHFTRAGIYQFNRYWAEARQHYKFVKTTQDAAEALFQIGRGYTQTAEYENAIPYYQSVIDHYPDTQQAKDSLLQLAAAHSRLDQTDEAIARYQNFIDKYPADDKASRAYLNIVDIYRDLGDDAHALEWCQRTEAAFPGKTPEALAIFDEAKIHASRSEWQDEIAVLDRLRGRSDLGGASKPGGTTERELQMMRAAAAYPRDPSQPKATADFQPVPIPSKDLKSTYPTEFGEIATRRSMARNIDPRLLLAIMQQESNFDPQARSNAAARGLMQFTHPQAVKITKELGWTYFSDDELYSPENSIALAAQYLADLNAMFPGQTEAVVASYNGGEDNVKRWMARAKSNEPERYVPELVFGQTKDYVAKVMANYRVYQHLYDENLQPK
jgi:soluble lytic murein transglycosylase